MQMLDVTFSNQCRGNSACGATEWSGTVQYIHMLNASLDHKVFPTHAGLDNSGMYAAGPTCPGDCGFAFSQVVVYVSCSHAQITLSQE